MAFDDDVKVRLSAQRALLTYVTARLRAVSVDVDVARRRVGVRFVFDGEPSEQEREAASCAAAEVIADYPAPWVLDEEYLPVPAPGRVDHLRLLAYRRCEDGD